jgi:hypothetical protein
MIVVVVLVTMDDGDAAAAAATGSFTTSLTSLRRGRGIEKRVVINCGGGE